MVIIEACALRTGTGDTGEGTANRVNPDRVLLPALNLIETEEVCYDGPRVLCMLVQSRRGSGVRALLEDPLLLGHTAAEGGFEVQVGPHPGGHEDPLKVTPDV